MGFADSKLRGLFLQIGLFKIFIAQIHDQRPQEPLHPPHQQLSPETLQLVQRIVGKSDQPL